MSTVVIAISAMLMHAVKIVEPEPLSAESYLLRADFACVVVWCCYLLLRRVIPVCMRGGFHHSMLLCVYTSAMLVLFPYAAAGTWRAYALVLAHAQAVCVFLFVSVWHDAQLRQLELEWPHKMRIGTWMLLVLFHITYGCFVALLMSAEIMCCPPYAFMGFTPKFQVAAILGACALSIIALALGSALAAATQSVYNKCTPTADDDTSTEPRDQFVDAESSSLDGDPRTQQRHTSNGQTQLHVLDSSKESDEDLPKG